MTANVTDANSADSSLFPIIDLSDFASPAGKAKAAEAIKRACETIGFFLVTGHGVPVAVSQTLKDASARYFALPEEEKALDATDATFRRGFLSSMGGRPSETYEISLDLPLDDPDVVAGRFLHGPNRWPQRHPWLQQASEAYLSGVLALGETLERAFALSLDLPEEFFVNLCRKPTLHMRLFHYFPRTEEQRASTFSAQPHTDLGMFTVLMPDANGGLQVQMRDETWVNALYVEDALVVNIGDMMELWTNGVYVSTPHRVVGLTGKDRYSVPVFFSPAFETVVECIPSCLQVGAAPKYAPLVAGQYLEQRLGLESRPVGTISDAIRALKQPQAAY